MTQHDLSGFSRVLTVHNGKGGCYKTSIASNVSGVIAEAGHRVLLLDFDEQGNTAEDLGYADATANDQGAGMATAILSGKPARPNLTARPNLDVICGGVELGRLYTESLADPWTALIPALGPLVDDYDMIVIDTPPSAHAPQTQMALGITRHLLVPTQSDQSSLKGLESVARTVDRAREVNPWLGLLGVVLVDLPTSATRMRAEALQVLEEVLGDPGITMPSSIRNARKVSDLGRKRGQLAHELASDTEGVRFWTYLREGKRPPETAASAPGLALDYFQLTDAVLKRIAITENDIPERE